MTSSSVYDIKTQTVLIHRSVYEKYGLYDEDLECKVDREMWLRLFGKKNEDVPHIKSYFLDEIVAYYRWHSKQVSNKRQKNKLFDKKNKEMCEKKYLIRKNGINKNNTRLLE